MQATTLSNQISTMTELRDKFRNQQPSKFIEAQLAQVLIEKGERAKRSGNRLLILDVASELDNYIVKLWETD